METINIEQIMEEIREEIKEKGYNKKDLSFDDKWVFNSNPSGNSGDLDELYSLLAEMEQTKAINYYGELTGGPLKKIIKKVIRKMVAFVIVPIVLAQNSYNERVYIMCKSIIERMKDNI